MYSMYRKVEETSVGLQVSDDKFALISDNNIERYEIINTVSLGFKSVVVAVSNGKFFIPNSTIRYQLQAGLIELNNLMNSSQEVDELKEIRNNIAKQVMYDDVLAAQEEIQGYKLGPAFD